MAQQADNVAVEFNHDDCLSADPFAGDFGDQGDRVLKDKIVKCRKPGPCHDCAQQIQPGEVARSMAAVFDGELMNFRWCNLCCAAMAKDGEDEESEWEKRIELGHKTRASLAAKV